MMLVVVFSVWLGWLPAQGFPRTGWSTPWLAFTSLLLPAVTIGIVEGAMLMRFVRSATLQAVGQDYVRTAAAKGLTRDQALIRHGLPNVGLSVITVLGLQVAGIIVGAVIIEQLFTLPGIGRMLVRRRRRARPREGAGRAARADRLRARRRLRRRPAASRDRSPAAGGVVNRGSGCGGCGGSPPAGSG